MYCPEFLDMGWLLSNRMGCLSISELLRITLAPKPSATIFLRRLFPILEPVPRSKWACIAGHKKRTVLIAREPFTPRGTLIRDAHESGSSHEPSGILGS